MMRSPYSGMNSLSTYDRCDSNNLLSNSLKYHLNDTTKFLTV